MKIGLHLLAAVTMMFALAAAARAQAPSFLTEEEKLVAYCAGVSKSRMRSLKSFIKNQCAASTRRECKDTAADLERAKKFDVRLWAYLTEKIYTSDERGKSAKKLPPR